MSHTVTIKTGDFPSGKNAGSVDLTLVMDGKDHPVECELGKPTSIDKLGWAVTVTSVDNYRLHPDSVTLTIAPDAGSIVRERIDVAQVPGDAKRAAVEMP